MIEVYKKILEYVDEYIDKGISINDLLIKMGYSRRHIYKIFHEHNDMPIMEYIRRKKIYAAAAELSSGRNIYDIALDYGYETSTGFYKAFQSVLGCSPSDYKNNILRSTIMDTNNIKSVEDLTKEIELDINNAELYIQRGKSYLHSNQTDKAIEDFNKALELISSAEGNISSAEGNNAKNKAEIYRKLGHVYTHSWQPAKIIENYSKAMELEPNVAADYLMRGQAYKNTQEYAKALEDFNKAMENETINPAWAYIQRGVCCFKLGETDKAEADFYNAIESTNKDNKEALAMVYMQRGQSYHYELKQIYKALEDFNQALELNPKAKWVYNNRAAVYQELKKYDKALEDYNQALELAPEAEWIHHNRFHLHEELKQYDKALEDLNKMIELNPKNSWQYIQRGILYEKLGEVEKAEKDYVKVAELDPENTQLYRSRFQFYEDQNKLEKALKDIDKAIELNPNDWFLYARRGNIYEKLANGEKAMENFIKLQEFDLDKVAGNERSVFKSWLYDSRAKSYIFAEQYEKAIEDSSKAIDFTSDEWKSLLIMRRAYCYEILGQKDKAEEDYAKATEYKPEWGYTDLAWRLILAKQYEKAAAMIEKARELDPGISPPDAKVYEYILAGEYDKAEAGLIKVLGFDAEGWWRRGTECAHYKQYDKAIECLERALELDPDYIEARELLDNLKADKK